MISKMHFKVTRHQRIIYLRVLLKRFIFATLVIINEAIFSFIF